MFRNVAGSIGISLSTAAITERSQAHSAHLAYHASPFNEQFQQAIRESAQAIQNFTTQVGDPTGIATGRMYQTMIEQSRFRLYRRIHHSERGGAGPDSVLFVALAG